MNPWSDFYNSIKDDSWPESNTFESFLSLPSSIQLEIIKDHLFVRQSAPKNAQDTDFLGTLRNTVGEGGCLLSHQDSVFLSTLISTVSPRTVVEVGTLNGYTTAIIANAMCGFGIFLTLDEKNGVDSRILGYLGSATQIIEPFSTIYSNLTTPIELVFVNRDPSYATTFRDLTKTYEFLRKDGMIVCHNADYPTVQDSIDDFLGVTMAVDCGNFGRKLRIFRKIEE
jgi:predicted O-methyltransferase YrrM